MQELETKDSVPQANNPTNQPLCDRFTSKRRLLSQLEPRVFECDHIEELSKFLLNHVEICRQMDMPLGLILMEVTNYDELEPGPEKDEKDSVNEVARHLLSVVRSPDVIV